MIWLAYVVESDRRDIVRPELLQCWQKRPFVTEYTVLILHGAVWGSARVGHRDRTKEPKQRFP